MFSNFKLPSKLELKFKKVAYYSRGFYRYFLQPDFLCKRKREELLGEVGKYDRDYIEERVNYYNRLDRSFELSDSAVSVGEFSLWDQSSTAYSLDLHEVIRYFPEDKKIEFEFGDVSNVPPRPMFVKSRPIGSDNQNSVLLKLNKKRHFHFITDVIPFEQKLDKAVWRGKAHFEGRQRLLETVLDNDRVNAGDVRDRTKGEPTYKPYMSIDGQLEYKFIISIEGRDVASNLKWIMASNSLCLMPEPRYETWYMEDRLEPGKHYVRVRDDYADLEEKMDYYIDHPEAAKRIIKYASEYAEQFRNPRRERLISLLTAKKYFERSGQWAEGE